ncbi:MAG: peptide deformylase [Nitrospira sp.]|nr:peptide deformylase [Nitrospira sp.]MBP6605481.1 peptide deformylase [Nitrospira sp.]HQY59622.1 peptide deformylase [Nitrospira sp.]HRA97567.1 peptide deformylase [Nitrospira sp.]
MAIRPILQYPHQALKSTNAAAVPSDPAVQAVVQDMLDTLAASPGVALAAPQIGQAVQVIVVDVSRKKGERGHGLVVLLNPVILSLEGKKSVREGCLSVPDYTGNVLRYEEALVEGLTPEGRVVTVSASGFEALAFQHEMDHLNGLLFLDRIESLSTDLFRRKK